jgi:hypothetical protein
MNRRNTTLATVAVAMALAVPTTALARDQQGLGIGANLTLGSSISTQGVGGIALNYWLSPDLMLEFMLGVGFALNDGPGPGEGDATFSLGGSVGFFGVLADGGDTNLMLGGRLGVNAIINQTGIPDADDNQAVVHIDVPLRVEHWFDDHFAINGQVGFALAIEPDTNNPLRGGLGLTTGFFGGAGFIYYFEGSGAAPMAVAPPPPERHTAPPPPPPPATTTTTEPDQESGAGW